MDDIRSPFKPCVAVGAAPRIESLDVLRGAAALSVVLWHWQHFFPPGELPSAMPLYWLFRPFYEEGHWGVDLFFCISGFVFFLLYAEKIASAGVTPLRFAVLRISRLYPLHILTLLMVVVVQRIYLSSHGHYFIYDGNTWRQFVLQLLMVQNWFPNEMSFNGPTWSLSVEVFLYFSFYLICRMRLTHPFFICCMSISGLMLWKLDNQIGRGLLSFYLGCLSAIAVGEIRAMRTVSVEVIVSTLSVILAASLAVLRSNHLTVAETAIRVAAFPGLVVAAALFDAKIERVTRRLRWLGDISYSSYLLHFPLQLTLVASGLEINYRSPVALFAFVAVLVTISLLSFHCFEKPMMTTIRSWSASRRPQLSA